MKAVSHREMMPNVPPPQAKSSPRSAAWLWGLLILLILSAIVWFQLSLAVSFRPTAQHTAALDRWQSAAMTDYRLLIDVQEAFTADAVYELIVRDGELVEVYRINRGLYQFDANPPRFEDVPESAYSYTVEALFDRAERLSRDFSPVHIYTPTQSHVRYDPALGYVTRFVDNRCGLIASISECLTIYEILEFSPLDS